MTGSALLLHQAYFGAVGGTSHGQLASSLDDPELRAFLAGITDRPGVVPAGLELPPYLTGATHGDYFLYCRTWPDEAVARPGMVFTHVLVLLRAAAEALPHLGLVLDQLLVEPPPLAERSRPLPALRLIAAPTVPLPSPTPVPISWLVVSDQLLTPASGSVLTSSEPAAFEQLLRALWANLSAPLRGSLNWGCRFTPPRAGEAVPTLVSIPPALVGAWRGQSVVDLTAPAPAQSASPVAQLLFGGEQQASFRDWLTELKLVPTSFQHLAQAQRAYEQYQRLAAGTAPAAELLALVRGLAALQPDPTLATAPKQAALAGLTAALTGQPTQMLALRNLPMVAFGPAADQLAQAVGEGVHQLVVSSTAGQPTQRHLLAYLAELDASRLQAWWQQAARTAFRATLQTATTAGAGVAWLALTGPDTVRDYLLEQLPLTTAWAEVLRLTVPTPLLPAVADVVVAFGAGHGWWELLAAVHRAAYPLAEALRRQVAAEGRLKLAASPRAAQLAEAVADTDLLALALATPVPPLITLAGARCAVNPALLATLDVQQPAWRAVWAAALAITQSLVAGLSDSAATLHTFLEEVAAGRATEILPLDLIADSPFANVLDLPGRAALWDHLPAGVRPRFLRATLLALVTRIVAGSWSGRPEDALQTAARTSDFRAYLLREYARDLAAVLAVEAVLPLLTDDVLAEYLRYLPGLTAPSALRLGQLVAVNRWQRSADILLERARTASDFWPALQACADLFSWWTRLTQAALFNYQPSQEDAWQLLTEVLLALYEKGPDESGIWKRAGGDPTQLLTAHTRQQQWQAAVGLLRYGGGGDITATSLLAAAQRQFPLNPQLQALSKVSYLLTIR